MSYWWVNHKQTAKQEFEGGYIWCPQTKAKGVKNTTYVNLTIVKPGDIVFSFANTLIGAIGVAERKFYLSLMPPEFGKQNPNWSRGEGFLVRINWTRLNTPFKPREYMSIIAPLLPDVHSPIRPNGHGNEGCYLAAINDLLGENLMLIAEEENQTITSIIETTIADIKDELAVDTITDSNIPELEKLQLIKARTGQGTFRQNVLRIESLCRITGLEDQRFLIASHIRPWRDSDNAQKIDGNNGLLLSPHVDRLFDKALITFSRSGDILFANKQAEAIATRWKFDARNIGKVNRHQSAYLEYHRDKLFEKNKKQQE